MNEIDVRIVTLNAMRVASVWGFGKEPELVAWEKLAAWAKPKGLLDEPEKHPIYGFNNPDPSPGSPNYGYELWIKVDPGVEPEGDVRITDFPGGLYAVTRCEVPKGPPLQFEVIPTTWKKLVNWREDSEYNFGHHQWLEKTVPSDSPEFEFVLDLYLPISK